jgi:ankyrin repeat protein
MIGSMKNRVVIILAGSLITMAVLGCTGPRQLYPGEKRPAGAVALIRSGLKALIVAIDDIPVGETYTAKTDWRKESSSHGRWLAILPGDHTVTVRYGGFYRHYNPDYAYILMTGNPGIMGKRSNTPPTPYFKTEGKSFELVRMKSDSSKTIRIEVEAGNRYEVRVELTHNPLRPDALPKLPELIAPADPRIVIINPVSIPDENGRYEIEIIPALRADQFVITDFPWQSYLVDLDARPDTAEKSVLTRAVETGDDDFVSLLLATGEDSKATDAAGLTPLHTAAETGSKRMIARLINAGADINARSEIGMTPLHLAAEAGRADIVRFLIENDADINVRNDMGATPLFYAAGSGDTGAVRVLLAAGADIERSQKNKWTPLHYATVSNHPGVVEVLLAAGANPNCRTDLGLTPLHVAANEGFSKIVDLMIAAGANVNLPDKEGWRPLHYVALKGDQDIASALIAAGADVNVVSLTGCAPLHNAAMAGNVTIGGMLLDHGAEVNLPLKNGWTPLDLALERKNLAFAAMLMDHRGARGNTKILTEDSL